MSLVKSWQIYAARCHAWLRDICVDVDLGLQDAVDMTLAAIAVPGQSCCGIKSWRTIMSYNHECLLSKSYCIEYA